MRERVSLDEQIQAVQEERTALTQKLNDALLKLDKHNKRKGEMSQKLVDQMAFVRDLERATANLEAKNLEDMQSPEVVADYNKEKELSTKLKD